MTISQHPHRALSPRYLSFLLVLLCTHTEAAINQLHSILSIDYILPPAPLNNIEQAHMML